MKKILVGTHKGLVIYVINGLGIPEFQRVEFKGFSVSMAFVDTNTQRWWVSISHKHWGQKLHYSDDSGLKWETVNTPSISIQAKEMKKLRQIWCMESAGRDKPGELWLGGEPASLFYSKDNGNSFSLVESLWNHPSRKSETQWFGAGKEFPFLHSICIDPSDDNHVYVAVSSAGVFETKNFGKSWEPRNSGLRAAYLPDPNVEIGHDPHSIFIHPISTNVMWQQNHCGIYYSINGGADWIDVSPKEGLSNYGFCLAIDEVNPAKAWVIPVESDTQRISPDLSLRVYQTSNYGETWESKSDGLPENEAFDIVLRQAFCKKDDFFVFGTTSGNIYYSNDSDEIKWKLLTNNLTKVNIVVIAD